MALSIYVPTQWVNKTAPAINSVNLNHIEQGIKSVTDSAIALEEAVAAAVPIGIVSMFSGAVIPDGWALCDGTQGTPNLVDKFVLGGEVGAIGVTGGSKDAVVVAHTHTGTTNSAGAHTHTYKKFTSAGNDAQFGGSVWWGGVDTATTSDGAHTHPFTTNSSGVSGTDKNMPPYYTLAYIMKIA